MVVTSWIKPRKNTFTAITPVLQVYNEMVVIQDLLVHLVHKFWKTYFLISICDLIYDLNLINVPHL